MTDAFAHAYCERPDGAVLKRARAIRLLALDVDGVLTDGSVFIGGDGEPFKAFHIHDGKGLSMLRSAGIDVAIITARQSEAVAERARELAIAHVRQGVKDKAGALTELADALALPLSATAFVGDDLVDLGPSSVAGFAVAVADAHPRLAASCHWQTRRNGGRGAVREVCELILASQGRLQPLFGSDA